MNTIKIKCSECQQVSVEGSTLFHLEECSIGKDEKKLNFDKFWKSQIINWDQAYEEEIRRIPVTVGALKEFLSEMFDYIERNLQERL